MHELPEIFSRLGIALGLGLLIGLQRQRTDARLAGFRTFPLVSLLGALCGLLGQYFGGWVVAAGFVSLALVIVGGNLPLWRTDEKRPGVTTEVAMLVMFGVGAFLAAGSTAIAAAVTGAIAVLLHFKPQMHQLAARIGERDFTAIMQFVLIFLVILPVLPNHFYGPYQILNPFKIWLMVVLIVGISLGGYLTYRFIGARAGAWASGILGGLISSTATTLSVARRSRQQEPGSPGLAAFVILMASSIVFVRVGILIGVTAPQLVRLAVVPLALMFAVLALIGWWNLVGHPGRPASIPEHTNPTELKSALVFGVLYALVLVGVEGAKAFFGQNGLYTVAVLSGLTDMDAITLSVTQLINSTQVAAGTGLRLILVAALANIVFKAGAVAVLADRRLFWRIAAGFGAAAAMAGGLLAFLPD